MRSINDDGIINITKSALIGAFRSSHRSRCLLLLCILIVGIHASRISIPVSLPMWIASLTPRVYQWESQSINLTLFQIVAGLVVIASTTRNNNNLFPERFYEIVENTHCFERGMDTSHCQQWHQAETSLSQLSVERGREKKTREDHGEISLACPVFHSFPTTASLKLTCLLAGKHKRRVVT